MFTPRTIAYWARVAEHKGAKAAIAGGQRGVRQGDRRSLSSSQEVLIRTLMTDKTPDQLNLGFALWTRDAVRELIRQRCGFLMPVRTVGEYLKRWGYTLQRPLHRAGVFQDSCHCLHATHACSIGCSFSRFNVVGPTGLQFLTERVPQRDGILCLACSSTRLRTCQPLIWNRRWMVFLFSPNSQATVR